MTKYLWFSILMIAAVCGYSLQKCLPSEFAKSRLVSGPATPDVNVTVTELHDRYVYSATGYTLSTSNGGPETSRGMLIVPELDIHGGSYSHYAWEMALIGHHVVIMKSIDGLSETEVYGKMIDMMKTDLDLHAWALVGHGYAGRLVARFASIDNGSRIKSVVILGAPLDVDLSDENRQVLVAYGLRDTEIPATLVQQSIQHYGSYETYVQALDIEHNDFAFTECVQDSDYRFESDDVPVFTLPNKTGSTEILNHDNKLLPIRSQIAFLCGASNVEYLQDSTWFDVGTNIIDVTSRLTHVLIEVKTSKPEYEDLADLLSDKKVRITFKCGLFSPLSQIEFYVNSKPVSAAEQQKGNYQMISNLAMGLMAWRYGTARGLHYGYDRIIIKETTPVPTRWYVWENATATRGIVLHVGGALHPTGYGGIATELKKRGYTVVIPAAVSRFSMLAVGQGKKIVNDPEFAHIQKWTLSGS